MYLLQVFLQAMAWLSTDSTSITLPLTNNTASANFTYNELYVMQTHFLDQFLYPANVAQAKSINSTLFSEDVQGRVDITRTFDGRELNTEYIFGLFANLAENPNSINLLAVPLSYEITGFAANEFMTASTTRYMFYFSSVDVVLPVEIDAWFAFNGKGEVTQYDATFKYWQWLIDTVIGAAAVKFNTTTIPATVDVLTNLLANSICETAQTSCTGDNIQYANATECLDFLTQNVRFGSAYELGRNTLLCRSVHQNMVPYRPSVHCPHIGPTGGGYCVDDRNYTFTVQENYFKTPFILPSK